MAANATITRRAALLGAFASSAALALPVADAIGKSPQAIEPTGVAPATMPCELAGYSQMTIGLRVVLVDLKALPRYLVRSETDIDGSAIVWRVSLPEPGAEYVVITPHDGRLRIARLVEGGVNPRYRVLRFGFMRQRGRAGLRVSLQVTVLGKVVGKIIE